MNLNELQSIASKLDKGSLDKIKQMMNTAQGQQMAKQVQGMSKENAMNLLNEKLTNEPELLAKLKAFTKN